ncbi:hypothetical protein [Pontibacter liquoris]|uniref:hypothetical protein n=1 Tax=Pontibacter liquoris TaxID=2905677 RepID=UPI001FA6BEDF|nr:hypothetical protein [Pontibacter liquoris]
MAATGRNARTTLVVQLSPTRNAMLSFTVLMVLALGWLGWAGYLLFFDSTAAHQGYLYYIFFGLALVFLLYVMLQNTSVFGVQSYFEITPQYIVQKYGAFRTKHIIPIHSIEQVLISPLALQVTKSDATKLYLDLKQVRKKRDLEKIKTKVRDMADEYGYTVTESASFGT